MTSLEEKFIYFCKDNSKSIMPGINDEYSIKEYTEFKQTLVSNFPTSNKIKEKRKFIDQQIVIAEQVDANIIAMYKEFEKPEIPDFIENKFPTGYNINDINNLKLENLKDSSGLFKKLFEKLFYKKYLLDDGELQSIFGSITNYARIATNSFGLMPIDGLWNLFNKYYKSASFDKEDFFKEFYTNLAINKDAIVPNLKNVPNVYDNIHDKLYFYKFDINLWYDFDFTKLEKDSYGVFYEKNTGSSFKNYVYLKYSNKDYINYSTLDDFKKDFLEDKRQFNRIDKKNFEKRQMFPFDITTFKKSIDKYFSENRKKPETLFKEIDGKTDYVEVEYDNDLYKSIRALLHFSNIYTTYLQLLDHFFTNIIECYNIYLLVCTKLKSKSNNSKSVNAYNNTDISNIQKKVRYLISIIKKIPSFFQQNLVDYNKDPSIHNKFLGFNNLVYDYFTIFKISDQNGFMKILMIFFKKNEESLQVGGIPLKLINNNNQINRDIIIALIFFIKYRVKSNKQFLNLLENIKKEAYQKQSTEKYTSVKKNVTNLILDLEKEIDISSIDINTIFENCKKIINFSTIIFSKLWIDAIKEFKYASGKFIPDSDILEKIGELKEYLNQYTAQLKEKLILDKYNIFHQFLYGVLSKYIYSSEIYGITKKEETFKELQGIPNRQENEIIQKKAKYFVNTMTIDSIVTKKTLFLRRKYNQLSNKAELTLKKEINPEIYTSIYWANYEKKFMEFNENKKLFVIAVQPVIQAAKISKVNVYLIDLFQTLKSDDAPKIRNQIKTDDIFFYNNPTSTPIGTKRSTITEMIYSSQNNIIDLNHSFRTIRDLAGIIQKSWSRNIKGNIKKKFFGRFFSAEGLHSPGIFNTTPGHRFAKLLGLYKRTFKKPGVDDGSEIYGYTATEILRLLINGDLSSGVDNNQKINFSLLMGYNNYQLDYIKNSYKAYLKNKLDNADRPIFGNTEKYNKYKYDASDPNNDWQIYIIKKEDYSSSKKMREWADRLLNSKPFAFPKKYIQNPNMIPLSNFSKIQKPFSRYFIKSWMTQKYPITKNITDYLLHIYDMIYENDVKDVKNKIFFSTETFFDFNIEKRNNNNSSRVVAVTTSGKQNMSSLAIKENAEYKAVSGIPEISKKLLTTLDPTRVKQPEYFVKNKYLNKGKEQINISNRLSLQEDLIQKLREFARASSINNDRITIKNEREDNHELVFDYENLSITYLDKTVIFNYDRKLPAFTAEIILNTSTLDKSAVLIQIGKSEILFLSIKKEYILPMKLNYSNKIYYLNTEYKDVDFVKIFGKNLNFKYSVYSGFLFYTRIRTKNHYEYELEFLDDDKETIFDVTFSVTFSTTDNKIFYDNYNQIFKNLWYNDKSKIGIISIPDLHIYYYSNSNRKGYKLVQNTGTGKNFNWSEITFTINSENEFKDYLRKMTGNTEKEKLFLTAAIKEFAKKHHLSTSLNSDGKYNIQLKDNRKYIIDTNKSKLIYNSTPVSFTTDSRGNLYAIIQDQDQINPEIKFIVTARDIYITHNFYINKNPEMNFTGSLTLNFSKEGTDLILDSDYSKNSDIQQFIDDTPVTKNIIEFFSKNGISYKNFLEIYFGETISSTTGNSEKNIFLRVLDKNRNPNYYLNFSIMNGSNQVYLENFGATEEFIELVYDTALHTDPILYTASDLELENGKHCMIIFNLNESEIYKFMTDVQDSSNGSYLVYKLEYNNGYSFTRFKNTPTINQLKPIAQLGLLP